MYKFIIFHAEWNIIKIIYVLCDLIPLRLVKTWPHCSLHKIQARCRIWLSLRGVFQKAGWSDAPQCITLPAYINSYVSR